MLITLVVLLEAQNGLIAFGAGCKAFRDHPAVHGLVERQANGTNYLWEGTALKPTLPRAHLNLYAVCTCITLGNVFRVTANDVQTNLWSKDALPLGVQPILWLNDAALAQPMTETDGNYVITFRFFHENGDQIGDPSSFRYFLGDEFSLNEDNGQVESSSPSPDVGVVGWAGWMSVGLGAGLALLAIIVGIVLFRRRRRKTTSGLSEEINRE
jgi:hypothetical protein